MRKQFYKFKKLQLDTTLIGFAPGESTSDYFCTPKGATVIGWAGVDGIHYCFVRGFGEMVFAVSPMNTPGDYVHPLAKDFTDFLQLLLACGDAAALEQAHGWSEGQFDAFLRENPPTDEQQSVFEHIRSEFSLTQMEWPFAYIKALQAEFDYSDIPFTADYYDLVPTE